MMYSVAATGHFHVDQDKCYKSLAFATASTGICVPQFYIQTRSLGNLNSTAALQALKSLLLATAIHVFHTHTHTSHSFQGEHVRRCVQPTYKLHENITHSYALPREVTSAQ